MNNSLLKWANVASFCLMILLNVLANALPLNGKNTGQLSDQYPNLFVPAGITFSIWGVIYGLLLGFMVMHFIPKYESRIQSPGGWVSLNFGFNALWILAWHYELLPASLFIMICIWGSLFAINYRLKTNRFGLEKISFGIYFGWICIAALANITALWVHYDWPVFGIPEPIWAVILIVSGTLVSVFFEFKIRNPFIGLAVIWALAGIMIKRQDDYQIVERAAILGAFTVTCFSFLVLRKQIFNKSL